MMGEKRGMKALELWCRRVTEGYPGVKIENMTTSWRDGLAFCALIHHFRPDLIDFDGLDKRDIYKNNELAFRIAERQLGIPALLDAEDMVEYEVPDRLSILTYLSQFYQTFVSNQPGPTSPSSRSHSTKVPDMISSSSKSQKATKVGTGRLESCWSCRRPVFLAERLIAGGKLRHRTCFMCQRCGHQLSPVGYYETEDGDFVCETCPDEEERRKISSHRELPKGEGLCSEELKDEYSLDFESALESNVLGERDESKTKFLQDLMKDSQLDEDIFGSDMKNDLNFVGVPFTDEGSVKNITSDNVSDNQYPTAIRKDLSVKIKNLLGRDFSDTLSLLNKESDSFVDDVSEIVDSIINDAVKKTEKRIEESLNYKASFLFEREKVNTELKWINTEVIDTVCNNAPDEASEEIGKSGLRVFEVKPDVTPDVTPEVIPEVTLDVTPEVIGDSKDTDTYPEDLNPFAEDEDEAEDGTEINERPVTLQKPPVPDIKTQSSHFNNSGRKVLEAPKVNLNPFWSDGEPSSDEDVTKPVPAPRTSLRNTEISSFPCSKYGSFTSLNSIGSMSSGPRRKKNPAPLPPSGPKSLKNSSSPDHRSPSPASLTRSHRKSKPAPPPPPVLKQIESELDAEKKEKNYENKVKQNLSIPDKSSYGKWKRKKGQAPGLPIPQRRRITPLSVPEVSRELEDLEIQQRELERQGVTIEQTIRKHESEATEGGDEGEGSKDVEELILQLFDIVNQKNELFRRQAELMLLRRQQRLEEEHADIEYQIRCLMGRPERNKTDSDKAQEEELIRRLVEVVERRNEIIECLDMDRKREVEEDESIHHHLEAFAGKTKLLEQKPKLNLKSSPSLLKYIKKKKIIKKEKTNEASVKNRKSGDTDVEKSSKENGVKTQKTKKTWFPKV